MTETTSILDYTNKDYASLREAMLKLAKEKLPEWTDHSPNDLGVTLLELFAYMSDMMLYYQDRIAANSYLETAEERGSIINLLRLIGYELRPPTPASADLTLLFDPEAIGTVTIPTGVTFQTSAEATGESYSYQYLRDQLDIVLSSLPLITHSDGEQYLRFDSLPVVQIDGVIQNEIVGSSDGSAAQRFPLLRAPVIDGQIDLTVIEGGIPEIWHQQTTLINSLSGDKHYLLRRDDDGTVYVEFGDGRHAKIPGAGRNNIKANYLVGGGIKGNVAAYTISKAVTSIDYLDIVFNEQPATGGADAETSEIAIQRGPQLFRAMQRAVTAEDYEAFALEFGLAKARARAVAWNHIEIFVAPVGGGQPTDTLKEDLRNYYEDKRMMSTIVDIKDPVYVNVCLSGELEIDPYHYTEQVKQKVTDAITELLSFDNVDFEFKLYLSKIYEAIESMEGVVSTVVTKLKRLDSVTDLPADGTLNFGWDEIPAIRAINWELDLVSGKWRWEIPC